MPNPNPNPNPNLDWQANADIEAKDEEGRTPLFRAVESNRGFAAVRGLLEAGAKPPGRVPLNASPSVKEILGLDPSPREMPTGPIPIGAITIGPPFSGGLGGSDGSGVGGLDITGVLTISKTPSDTDVRWIMQQPNYVHESMSSGTLGQGGRGSPLSPMGSSRGGIPRSEGLRFSTSGATSIPAQDAARWLNRL